MIENINAIISYQQQKFLESRQEVATYYSSLLSKKREERNKIQRVIEEKLRNRLEAEELTASQQEYRRLRVRLDTLEAKVSIHVDIILILYLLCMILARFSSVLRSFRFGARVVNTRSEVSVPVNTLSL